MKRIVLHNGDTTLESYQQLHMIKDNFKNIPLLAITATATPKVLDDMYNFNVEEVAEYNIGTRRENLHISVVPKTKNILHDLDIEQNTNSTIIYTRTRKGNAIR